MWKLFQMKVQFPLVYNVHFISFGMPRRNVPKKNANIWSKTSLFCVFVQVGVGVGVLWTLQNSLNENWMISQGWLQLQSCLAALPINWWLLCPLVKSEQEMTVLLKSWHCRRYVITWKCYLSGLIDLVPYNFIQTFQISLGHRCKGCTSKVNLCPFIWLDCWAN